MDRLLQNSRTTRGTLYKLYNSQVYEFWGLGLQVQFVYQIKDQSIMTYIHLDHNLLKTGCRLP